MRTLRNAVEQDKVHHAYLFVGSRGTGKTSMAKILAACLNCEHGPTVTPCGVCESCVSIASATSHGRHRDGRGVEQLGRRHPRPARARRLRAGVGPAQDLHPRRGAHALAAGVERVPQDARGAAAATRSSCSPRPRRRRCCRRSSTAATASTSRARPSSRSRRCCAASPARRTSRSPAEALALLARHATGSFRDALGTLEQLVTYSGHDDHDGGRARGPRRRRHGPALLGARRGRRPRRARGAARRRAPRRHGPRPDARSCRTSRRTRATSGRPGAGRGAGRAAAHARPRRPPRRPGRRASGAARSRGCSTCSPPRWRRGATAPTRARSSSSRS